VLEWVRGFTPAHHLVVVPGVGHFFHGHLAELRDAVGNVLRSG
jgi:alpha/beta superfamily hydrolase